MEPRRTKSVGGIVLGDGGTIAMVRHSVSNGMWLFPKGHPEEGETDEETARREIEEEAGVSDLEFLDDLGTYTRYHIRPDGTDDPTELKEIHMFLFAAPMHATLTPSHEMDGARWIPLTKVGEECGSIGDRVWFSTVFERVRQAIQRD
ncbi:MAG TPA: NUDIX hydrolase [Candidatus Paceibacterota bacterium]|nr:NUDIX hydrolase [Candidatus Paceibacterota bacterium]